MNKVDELKGLIQIKNKELLKLKMELENYQKDSLDLDDQLKNEVQRKKTFNGLTAKEWTILSRSVWNDVSSTRSSKHLKHGATFPKKLAERIISMYSKNGDTVLDPFVGTGTTLYAARDLDRYGIGIELNLEFIKFIEGEIFLDQDKVQLINGDCLEKIDSIPDESIQLTFTSPPYADLLHKVKEDRELRHKTSRIVLDNNSTSKPYSNDKNDFGNMNLNEFEIKTEELMDKIFKKTSKGGYNIWVVKDFRDTQSSLPYIDFHTLIAKVGEKAGFKYHDLIIWDQNEQRSLVLLGYPSVFYVNQNHSFIVVLRK